MTECGRIWSNMAPIWSSMTEYGLVWTNMEKYGDYGRIYSSMFVCSLVWLSVTQYIQVWANMVESDPG